MKHKIIAVMSVCALAGCRAQSQSQWSYDVDKVTCQDYAAEALSASGVTSNRSATLRNNFNSCMRKEGWKMATTKPPVTDPPLEAGKRAPTVHNNNPAYAGQGQQPGTQQPPLQPGTTQPSPAATAAAPAPQPTPAATPAQIPAGAATYQPVQPPDVPLTQTPAVQGAGNPPGRHF